MGRSSNKIRHQKKRAFLAAYAECGTVTHAAEYAGISRDTHYEWLKDDAYRQAFEEAYEEAIEHLEVEARRRAASGVDEPVFYLGQQVGAVRKYSDNLLMFLLKAARPERYKDRQHHTVDVNIRKRAEQIAEDYGLDVDEVIAEAERIANSR